MAYNHNWYLLHTSFYNSPVILIIGIILICVLAILYLMLNKYPPQNLRLLKKLDNTPFNYLSIAIILIISCIQYTASVTKGTAHNNSVIFNPLYEISLGGTLGIDVRSLYGSYPYFIYGIINYCLGKSIIKI